LIFYALSMEKTTPDSFFKLLVEDLGFTATDKQDVALQMLSEFVVNAGKDRLFLLRGFAGTGKNHHHKYVSEESVENQKIRGIACSNGACRESDL